MKNKKPATKNPFQDLEDMTFIPGFDKPKRIYSTPVPSSQEHIIYLDDEIGSPSDYREEFQLLRNAGPEDVIYLVLCSPGGDESTGFMFVDHIRQTQANVIAVIGPDCCSACADIALSCQAWILSEFSQMLVHNVAYGIGFQKEQDVYDYVTFKKRQSERLAKSLYEGFLKPEEFDGFIKGAQMWFNVDDLRDRLASLAAHRRTEEEKQVADEEAEELAAEEAEEFEDVEFDEGTYSTWPEGTEFEALKGVGGLRKGQHATILRFHETDMGDAVEFISDTKWGIISPLDGEYLKFISCVE